MGVAFTTMATLLLELAMTRIFSVVFYYHFAFLAISIALFGLGAGGVFSYVIAAQPAPLFRKLGRLSLINAIMPLISVIFILTRGQELTNATLAAVYFFSALPFFLAGAIVSLAISETIERIDRVYFFDLLGAAGGCLLLIPLLNNFGGPNTVIAAAVLFAVGAAIWYNLDGHPPLRAASVAIALLLTVLIVLNTKSHWIDVHYAKGQALDNEIFVKWNTFSRISVAKEKTSGQTQIVIDADASTGIMDFNVDALTPDQLKDLTQQGPAFPYVMRPGAKTLIIGPGGGWDVARALASGSKDITGVEINPIIATTVMRGDFAWISRNLYRRPGIRIFEEDGRSFVRRSEEKYSVLQATLVDTWASTAAGAFALSENNLYTTDAFYDYLSHLNDDGVLAITRWGFDPPRESVRLLILAREALAKLGENEPQRHVMVIREGSQKELEGWGARDTVLISRKPFTDADIARAQSIIATSRFQQIYLPGDGSKNPFGQALLAKNLDNWLENYPFDVTAVDDNRPFFFYTVQPRDLWNFLTTMNKDSADYKINRAVPMLFSLVGISLLATLIILALPPLVLGTRLPREKGVLQFLMYFLCIGVGYILIQVALIQKFVLFLGHPTYALTVIIFSMLVASGCGSFLSGKYIGDDDNKLMRALGLVSVLVAMLAFSASHITTALVGLPLPIKMLLTVLLIAPAGFCMGMPFPQGLARLETFHKPSVRWAWSLNAASSVLGSAAAIFFAIYLGLRETLLLGGALYIGALIIIKNTSHHRSQNVS
jgi:hypothetical protein